jgi:hypothetical protein
VIRQQLAQNAKQGRSLRRHEIHENVAVIGGARVTEDEQESQTLDLSGRAMGAEMQTNESGGGKCSVLRIIYSRAIFCSTHFVVIKYTCKFVLAGIRPEYRIS